jgi:hypothetical protein
MTDDVHVHIDELIVERTAGEPMANVGSALRRRLLGAGLPRDLAGAVATAVVERLTVEVEQR